MLKSIGFRSEVFLLLQLGLGKSDTDLIAKCCYLILSAGKATHLVPDVCFRQLRLV